MKKTLFLLAVASLLLEVSQLRAQTCTTVLDDNFTTNSGWTQVGSGTVSVSGGACTFNNAFAGVDNRVHKTLSTTLSNTYWKTECKITFNGQNPSGNGAGCEIVSLTAGTLAFMSYDASQGYLETTQDAIGVILSSSSASDENRNNWFFLTEAKLGNNRTYNIASAIYASSSVDTYYLRLERTSSSMTQMSVCTDSLFTMHMPGSPSQFAINPAISGLSVIQHASNVPGTSTRMFNGTVDNDVICHDGSIGMEEVFNTTASDAIVFPNPATTFLWTTLTPDNAHPVQYTVLSASGTIVLSDVLKNNNPIDISRLAQGCYILLMVQDEKMMRSRFVKTE